MKMHKKNEAIPQVVPPTQGKSTLGSDRMKAPVAHGSGMDSEDRNLCEDPRKTATKTTKTDERQETRGRIILGLQRRNRTASASSAGSAASCTSAYDSEAASVRPGERTMTELLKLIQTTATKMAEAAAVQKNMNMTVKTGIKTILEAVDDALSRGGATASGGRTKDDETTETEAETKTQKTPRTKRRREATGTTPESLQKRTPKVVEDAAWQPVTRKKKTKPTERTTKTNMTNANAQAERHRSVPKHRGAAVLVKPGKDSTYSDIVRKIRTTVDPTKSHVQVTTVRRTKDGLCLIKMQSNTDERDVFRRVLQDAVGDAGSVKAMTSQVQVEIMDLDCVVTQDDVTQALRQATGRDADFRVHIFGPNRAEQYMAVCDLESHEAEKLLDRGRIGIGWVRCRVRKRLTVTKCHKCQGYGHTKANCTGKDRTKSCRRCGETGHYATDCKNRPACPLCAEAGHGDAAHLAGTGRCAVFRAALEECRRQAGRRTE